MAENHDTAILSGYYFVECEHFNMHFQHFYKNKNRLKIVDDLIILDPETITMTRILQDLKDGINEYGMTINVKNMKVIKTDAENDVRIEISKRIIQQTDRNRKAYLESMLTKTR